MVLNGSAAFNPVSSRGKLGFPAIKKPRAALQEAVLPPQLEHKGMESKNVKTQSRGEHPKIGGGIQFLQRNLSTAINSKKYYHWQNTRGYLSNSNSDRYDLSRNLLTHKSIRIIRPIYHKFT